MGYTITINARVTNYDSIGFSGQLDFGLRNNQQTLGNAPGVFHKPAYSGNQISLNGYESVPAIFSVHLDPAYFAPGPDVVVVWPICNKPGIDSVVINFTIVDPSGINDVADDGINYIVTSERIFIKNPSPQIEFKQVRFYNIMGQQLNNQVFPNTSEIPVPGLPHGIYLCELVSAQGKRKVIKFFH